MQNQQLRNYRHRLSVRRVVIDDKHLNRGPALATSRGLWRHESMIRPSLRTRKGALVSACYNGIV